jgi:dimethylargininase
MPIALTRPVPSSISRCELTHRERLPIDATRAAKQHREYEQALESIGYRIQRIADTPDLPDSVFVEDTAIVLDDIAIITRPGAESRRLETLMVAIVLDRYRPTAWLAAPALMDGGDVLRLGRRLFVGLSTRTNEEGARQLARFVQPLGYTVRCLRVRGCLHLKSAVTALDENRVLHNPDWVETTGFDGVEAYAVDPAEPDAANVLTLGSNAIVPAVHTRTQALLSRAGFRTIPVDVSELAKAEAGVTCCSLIIDD